MFTSVLPLKIQLSRGEGWVPINRFNPTTFLCLSQARTWCVICHGLFYVHLFEVRGDCWFCWYWWNCWPSLFKTFFCFVDIGGIVDHHCLKLSFHNHFDKSYKTSILPFNLSIVVFVSSSIVCSSTICAVTPDIQSSFSVCFTCNFIQSVKLRRRKMGVC